MLTKHASIHNVRYNKKTSAPDYILFVLLFQLAHLSLGGYIECNNDMRAEHPVHIPVNLSLGHFGSRYSD